MYTSFYRLFARICAHRASIHHHRQGFCAENAGIPPEIGRYYTRVDRQPTATFSPPFAYGLLPYGGVMRSRPSR